MVPSACILSVLCIGGLMGGLNDRRMGRMGGEKLAWIWQLVCGRSVYELERQIAAL